MPANTAPIKLLSLPSDILRKILLHTIDPPNLSPTLSDRTLPQSDAAFSLSSTCTHLRHLFCTLIQTLHIPWDTPVYLHTLASLFGPSLQALSITAHPHAEVFLHQLAAFSTLRLTSISLRHCPLPTHSFSQILSHAPPLKSLHLAFVDCPALDILLQCIAPHLSQLHSLFLAGVSHLTHTALLAVCVSAAASLRDLSLRYIRHSSICGDTLHEIGIICPNLESLFLDDVRHVSASAVVQLCTRYAHRLRALRLCACKMSAKEVCAVLRVCKELEELGLEEQGWSSKEGMNVMEAIIRSTGLREVYVRGVKGMLDRDLRAMVEGMRGLEHVSVRRAEEITDSGVVALSKIGERLRSLDLRGCFVSDYGLEVLGKQCTNLETVRLGGDGVYLTEEGAARVEADGVSEWGIERLLEGCGHGLREFVWDTPRCRRRGASARNYSVGIGLERLTGVAVVTALIKWTPVVEKVEIYGLRPSAREVVRRAKFDLAVIELEETARYVVVSVDSERRF